MESITCEAKQDLERRLTERVRRLLGETEGSATRPAGGLFGQVSAASSRSATHVGERVSSDLATVVAGVVSTSIAIVVGTVTGGFGEAVGVALLIGLVESGLVDWVMGAVGGLVLTGVAFVLGRKRLQQSVKEVALPAAALKVIL